MAGAVYLGLEPLVHIIDGVSPRQLFLTSVFVLAWSLEALDFGERGHPLPLPVEPLTLDC
eukprot:9428439-Pyramimonas_sp.AAC.1